MILEPKKIKSDTVSTISPSISHEVMGPDAIILVFCGSVVKSLPAMQETQVQSLGLEDPLEEGMATHSRTLV